MIKKINFQDKKFFISLAALMLILVIILFWGLGLINSNETSINNTPTFTVRRGPLKISVTEAGSIQAREKIVIKSKVEGMTSIMYLIDEGSEVKKGDLLVELDSSALLDQKIEQEIRAQNADAAFVGARENLAVGKNQAQSDIDGAILAHEFAIQDLEKYLKGEYPNQLKETMSRIILAREELARASEKLKWSIKLAEEKYISETELQVDELSEKKKKLDLELAENDLSLLKNYTHKRSLAQLNSDVKQSRMALERTKRKATADILQAEANLKAKEAELNRQKDKLKKTIDQITKTKIYAPANGLVIYANSASGGHWRRRSEPLEVGGQVRERQELIHLPTSAGYDAEIGVFEASLNKVKKGLTAVITIDALPGETYEGKVSFIAPLPDPQSAFLNPDLKVYNTVIELTNSENTELLRAGMNCTVDIVVKQFKEATYIPVQSVLRIGGVPTVFVLKNSQFEQRQIETGLNNNSMIRVISGLEPGEIVSLAPPLSQAGVIETDETETTDSPDEEKTEQSSPEKEDQPKDKPSFSAAEFLNRLDLDKDGKVSKDEFPGKDQAFTRLDKDQDGFLIKSEIPKRMPKRQKSSSKDRSSSNQTDPHGIKN